MFLVLLCLLYPLTAQVYYPFFFLNSVSLFPVPFNNSFLPCRVSSSIFNSTFPSLPLPFQFLTTLLFPLPFVLPSYATWSLLHFSFPTFFPIMILPTLLFILYCNVSQAFSSFASSPFFPFFSPSYSFATLRLNLCSRNPVNYLFFFFRQNFVPP